MWPEVSCETYIIKKSTIANVKPTNNSAGFKKHFLKSISQTNF